MGLVTYSSVVRTLIRDITKDIVVNTSLAGKRRSIGEVVGVVVLEVALQVLLGKAV
jgi:hypothetical protein